MVTRRYYLNILPIPPLGRKSPGVYLPLAIAPPQNVSNKGFFLRKRLTTFDLFEGLWFVGTQLSPQAPGP